MSVFAARYTAELLQGQFPHRPRAREGMALWPEGMAVTLCFLKLAKLL